MEVPPTLESEIARLEQGFGVLRTLQSEFACLEQGMEVLRTLQSEFACLENGFTGVTGEIAAASGCFRTTGGERKPYSIPSGCFRTTGGERKSYSIPSGQNRTPVYACDEQGWTSGYEYRLEDR